MNSIDPNIRNTLIIRHPDDLDENVFENFDPRVFRRIYGFVRPYRLIFFAAIVCVVAFVVTQVSIPYLIRKAVDGIIGKPGSLSLDAVLFAFLIMVGANAIASFLQEITAARLAQRVIFDMRRQMFAHLQDVALSFTDQVHVGRIMSRLQGDVNALQEFLETSIAAAGDLFLLFGIVFVLVAMEWRLALLTLSVVPMLIAIRTLWLPRAKEAFHRAHEASSTVNAALAENIGGVRTVQGARREELNLEDFSRKVESNFKAHVHASWISQSMVPVVDTLTGLAMGVVVVVGGWMALDRALDVGIMVAFIFYVQRFFDPIRNVSQQYTLMQRAMAAGRRIFEVLDIPITISDKPGAFNLRHIEASIEFRNVTFGYNPGQIVLKNLFLKIAPREVVALVGPTGSGKSSVAALLHRFYDVNEGQILIGGHDVREVTKS